MCQNAQLKKCHLSSKPATIRTFSFVFRVIRVLMIKLVCSKYLIPLLPITISGRSVKDSHGYSRKISKIRNFVISASQIMFMWQVLRAYKFSKYYFIELLIFIVSSINMEQPWNAKMMNHDKNLKISLSPDIGDILWNTKFHILCLR